MYATDVTRQTDVRRASSINACYAPRGRGHNNFKRQLINKLKCCRITTEWSITGSDIPQTDGYRRGRIIMRLFCFRHPISYTHEMVVWRGTALLIQNSTPLLQFQHDSGKTSLQHRSWTKVKMVYIFHNICQTVSCKIIYKITIVKSM